MKVPAALQATDNQGYRNHIELLIKDAQAKPREAVVLVNLARRWSIADRNPIRQWHDGNVTLIGDAAHATLQSYAQGAGMALEDAVILADLVEEHGDDHSEAFRRFNSRRFLRTARLQLESRTLWEEFHCGGIKAEAWTLRFVQRQAVDHYRCLVWLWTPELHQYQPQPQPQP